MCIIQTKRTSIRRLSLDDAPFILELVNTPEWLRYIGDRNIHNIKAAEQYLVNSFLKTYEQYGFSYYLVQIVKDIPIGICGFLKKPYLEHEDFGFAYLPKYYSQGYGYEVSRAVLKFGITNFHFKILDAVTNINNVPSIGLLLKLGFKDVGLVKKPDSNDADWLKLFRWAWE
ncbi:GNAT family N-acetyltransferase [Acidobacteriota bacterium]